MAAPKAPRTKDKTKKRPPRGNDMPTARQVTEPEKRSRAKRESVTEYVNVEKAQKRALAFPDQGLVEKDGLLHCLGCNKAIAFQKKGSVRQHCFGSGMIAGVTAFQARTEQDKLRLKHYERLQENKARATAKNALVESIQRQRAIVDSQNAKMTPQGATLPPDTMADRVQVCEDMWANGIPINKLKNDRMVNLIEREHATLGGVNGIRDAAPFAARRIRASATAAVKGRLLSIFFDGSKVNELIEGMVVRYIDDDDMPRQLCVGVSAIERTMDSALLKTLIEKHIAEVEIQSKDIVAAISDSAATNIAAMNQWNELARSHLVGQELRERTLLHIGCFMHAMSNCGTVLRKSLPRVKRFMSAFKKMTNTSDTAKKLWLDKTKEECPGLADKSFWAWWQVAGKILRVWVHVRPFLESAGRRGVSDKSVEKMLVETEGKARPLLKAELEFCVLMGKPFHDAGFLLEGDGFCSPFVQEYISLIRETLPRFRPTEIVATFQHVLTATLGTRTVYQAVGDSLARDLQSVSVQVTFQLENAVVVKMAEEQKLYRAAGIFHPRRLEKELLSATWATETRPALINYLAGLKGLQNPERVMENLEVEWIVFQRESRARFNYLGLHPLEDTPPHHWMWIRSLRSVVPAWYEVASILCLIQPSSACIERFFSISKRNTSAQQNQELPGTRAARLMTVYNTKE